MHGVRTRLGSAVLAIDRLHDLEAYATRLAFFFKALLALHFLTALALQIGSMAVALVALYGAGLLVRGLAQLLTRVPSCTLHLTFVPRTPRAGPTPVPARRSNASHRKAA